jgi:hypothetical protein
LIGRRFETRPRYEPTTQIMMGVWSVKSRSVMKKLSSIIIVVWSVERFHQNMFDAVALAIMASKQKRG